MKIHLSYLLLLTMLTIGLGQENSGIDLGGESVATSIVPLRRDTAQASRFNWLDLAFRDLVVSYPNVMSGTTVALVEFTPYERLEAYEFLRDKAAFYRYFMHKMYQLPRPETTVENTSVPPDGIPNKFPKYPIVQEEVYPGNTGEKRQANPRFVPLVTLDALEADTVYLKQIAESLALNELYQLAVAHPNPIERIAGKEYHFKHERYFQEKAETLRALAYDMYALLNEQLVKMYDDPSIETDTAASEQNRCVVATREEGERPVYICERELMTYATALQQQPLTDTAFQVLNNTSGKLKESLGRAVENMESVATKYQLLQAGMTEEEQHLFDWIISKTQPFCQNYHAVQQQLNDYSQLPVEQTSYWHLMTFAEYFRVLESFTSDNSGKQEALVLYQELCESYRADIWELEAQFLDLQANH